MSEEFITSSGITRRTLFDILGVERRQQTQMPQIVPGTIIVNVNIENSTINVPSLEPSTKKGVRAKMGGGVFTSFIDAAMKEAIVEKLSDGTFYAEIPSCPGVWADGKTKKECLETLQEVLEEWLLFKLREGDRDFPVLGGVDLNREWTEDRSWAG
ncbi:Uncharacterised protein family UPF0150 [Thermanaeromonas toyohensis ToBE]|uniref:Uncharacterized protein family UPF0150 n=1 Tax=Thermanaeromonas toyohensis ToBE TaxID=698762 RepID=A0A1W1VXP3_9FIRM|nr:type II toxin-antitoxin system HicB family antitoxin [Thermanaeromonas toyohensis]SMB98020.1 Uncharacterised protein family UPF0150 [Thermanaeromonas toyohensis ToBE]